MGCWCGHWYLLNVTIIGGRKSAVQGVRPVRGTRTAIPGLEHREGRSERSPHLIPSKSEFSFSKHANIKLYKGWIGQMEYSFNLI